MFFPLKRSLLLEIEVSWSSSSVKRAWGGHDCQTPPRSIRVRRGQKTTGGKKSIPKFCNLGFWRISKGNCKMLSAAECKCLCSEHPGLQGGRSTQLNSTARHFHADIICSAGWATVWHQFQGTAQPGWALLHAPVSFTHTLCPSVPLPTYRVNNFYQPPSFLRTPFRSALCKASCSSNVSPTYPGWRWFPSADSLSLGF